MEVLDHPLGHPPDLAATEMKTTSQTTATTDHDGIVAPMRTAVHRRRTVTEKEIESVMM